MTREEYEKSKQGQPTVSKKQLKKNKKRKYDAEEVAAVVRDPVGEVEETHTHSKSLEEREKEYNEKLAQQEVNVFNKFAKEQAEKGSFNPRRRSSRSELRCLRERISDSWPMISAKSWASRDIWWSCDD